MKSREEIQLEFLERCVKEFKIFMDTSSFLEDSTEKFLVALVPLLVQERKAITVPKAVVGELEKFAKNPDYCRKKDPNKPNLNRLAIAACKNISLLLDAELVKIYGDKDDGNFADHVFLKIFMSKRLKYDMLLITQDKDLASDILRIGKDSGSVKGVKKIMAQRINEQGFLEQVFDNREKNFTPSPKDFDEEIPSNERFAVADKVVNIVEKVSVSNIPTTGDYVIAAREKTRKKIIRLTEKIGSGDEGIIYKTNQANCVAKIFKPAEVTLHRFEKLKLMLTKKIDYINFCYPIALIYNSDKIFTGYLMREASGRELQRSVFKRPLLEKYFPNWTREDTVQLCVTILKRLKYLHDRNIILGDINPGNILVESPTEVYFVDADSWQVEGFICSRGLPAFTAPEIQHHKRYDYLRTLGNENFAVATLLFMIMMPGRLPYTMQGGEGIAENILNGDFPYPLGEKRTGKVPGDLWRYCWSHLTYKIKEAFYNTFRFDGDYHDEKKRLGTGHWLKIFEEYLSLIKSGKMTLQDEESIKIFPTRFKKDKNKNYVKCKICSREYDEERLQEGICRDCLNDGEKYHCEKCGREMIYTNYQKYIKNAKRFRMCKDCFEKSNMIYERKECRDCGKIFDITYGEKEYFIKNGMDLPARCQSCRDKHTTIKNFFRDIYGDSDDFINNIFQN